MHEVDLIPQDYRLQITIIRYGKRFSIFIALLLLVSLASYIYLENLTQQLNLDNIPLQKEKNNKEKLMEIVLQNQEENNKLLLKVLSLEKLRNNYTIKTLFEAIDKSLSKNIWFQVWDFKSTNTTKNLSINGQALNHSYLSTFVQKLTKLNEIQSVRIISTSLKTYNNKKIIDFKLEIIAKTKVKNK